jgi:transcriptional regulator with XRE-family HTH domain
MSIHQRIRQRRQELGMASHKALATKLNVAWQTVQLWEKEGGTAPNRARIGKVAEVLQVSVEWLTTGRGAPGAESDSAEHRAPDRPTDAGLPVEAHSEKGLPRLILAYEDEINLLEAYRLADPLGQHAIRSTVASAPRRDPADVLRNQG